MTVFAFDGCELDLDQVELRVHGRPRPVEPQVFDVLAHLVRHRDRMVTKVELLDEVWHSRFVTESALSSRIKSARQAIGDDGRAQRLIRTVHGRGYRFVGDVRVVESAPVAQRCTPVPPPATPTIGRERDIAEVLRLLDRARVVTLLGPGGVGKTRLAAEAALRHSGTTGAEACFVDLTKVGDAALVPDLIARQLGVREEAEHSLEEALRGRSLLLVLDNFEHVVSAAGIVGDVVRWAPAVHVLITSRARLRVAGEQVFDVAPLSLDPREGGAVALFAQAATAVDPSFELEPNLADVVAICRMVDGLPLAIELAAGHVRTLPPALLRTRLPARLHSAAGAARDAPDRQRTVPAMIDWSLHLLGAPEKQLFTRLGVFAGPVPLQAVERVCADPGGDVIEALTTLVDQSLVRRVAGVRGEPRFVQLELLRERARELLAGVDAAAVARRHAGYVAAYVEDLEERRWSDAADRWIEAVGELLGEIRAAHAWAAQHGEVELATRITASLGLFWNREGHLAEGRAWVAEALATRDQLDAGLAARLQLTAGLVAWHRSELEARRHWEAASEAFRALGHERYLAYASAWAAATYIGDRARYAEAMRLCDEAIERARRVGERPLLALALNARGELARVHGDDEVALAAYREGIEHAAAAGDQQHLSMFLNNLSFVADHRGDHREARRLSREALRLSWSIGRRMTAAANIVELAGSELGLGRPDRGARLLGAADEALRVLGAPLHHGDRSEHARVVAGLRAALGDDAFRYEWAEGARLSLDEAVDLALD